MSEKVKSSTLRDMTREELDQRRRDLEDEWFNLRMRKSIKQLENPLRMRQIGREIAQVMTILREDELGVRKLAQSRTSLLDQASGKKS